MFDWITRTHTLWLHTFYHKASSLWIAVELKLPDLWVGIYPSVAHSFLYDFDAHEGKEMITRVDVYICLLPCLPIHIAWEHDNHVPF